MITQKLLELVAEFVGALINVINSTMPSLSPPAWLDDVGGVLNILFEGASSMGAWLPIKFGLIVVTTVLATKVLGFALKIFRIVASFATLGGGAAG